ncbi:phage major capsid protein [Paenibacillus sepulcri]|uniref:Phage major capsid protein n=1 Tax=Paenibacillus sepulcri TaxID=359917 RepID=A0ABS7BV26_9BACL|nr:phage major capsid protein [Paenibacillus sepulcri]
MTKELRALLAKLEQMRTEVRSMLAEDKTTEAKVKMEELRALQAKIELQRELEDEEHNGSQRGTRLDPEDRDNLQSREDAELETEYRSIFLRGLRRRSISNDMRSVISEYERRAVLNEGETNPAIPDGDLSILVPKDVQTRINNVVRSLDDLSQFINVVPVTALSGSRVLEAYGTMTPFEDLSEYAPVEEIDGPKFRPVDYKLKDRGGFLPLTSNLLQDTDQNLLAYITDWIGRKAVVTRNTLITTLLNTLTKTDLVDFDAIKRVLNVTLDPAISKTSTILTNQDGFNWMDEQKDTNGRYLLTDDITQAGGKLFKGRRIAVVANRYLPSDTVTEKAPVFIGDLQQAIVLFSRQFYELASTTEGGDAWRRRTTELRTIMRDDIQKWDTEAVVFGELDIA